MKDEPVLEELAGLIYAPTADYPFGKTIQIGPQVSIIYERAIENGYHAGIQAFKDYLETHDDVEIPTDHEITNMIDLRLPRGLSSRDVVIWRSYFVVGYTCAHLGLVHLSE